MTARRRVGVLLVNVGTPDSTAVADVRRYLAAFLMDPRVIDVPAPLRWLLVHGVILRTRPARAAAAYASIWTAAGSPLLVHSLALLRGLREQLGADVVAVELGMRYREPSIGGALDALAAVADEILIVPLYPQYSQAATASAMDAVHGWARQRAAVPALRFLPPFHAEPEFLDAVAAVARPELAAFAPDHVLMSFHGLPRRHIERSDRTGGRHCLATADCCARSCAANAFCYRAQCHATALGIATRLELPAAGWEVSFQSRLTQDWIQPFTDVRLVELARAGVRRLAVLCPSFVADCLETLEEIGGRARRAFRAAGGEDLCAVPCVNASAVWVRGLADIVRRSLGEDGVVRGGAALTAGRRGRGA